MKQEPKSIHEFNPGDIVTRIEPAIMINKSMFLGGMNYDSSYIGEKLIFLGIANGCAYFEPTDSFSYILEKGKPISLELHRFETGWANYIDPIIFVGLNASKYAKLSDVNLLGKLGEAIGIEDYEEASRIQHEIDKREL